MMTNYLDVYFSRINHLGNTTAERIRNGGIRSFHKWMAESPFTVQNLSTERGLYFDAIIEENKDKEAKKIMFLQVANEVALEVGDIMNWRLDNGAIEKWILFQEEKKTNPTYRTFWIIRCNYLLKWIDADGHLQESWSYVVSSEDSKVKANFRTWNNLITPQPNKFAEILMPRREITRSTNFIIEDESWITIEYDHTSVPGIIYLSLTENKINTIYDDTVNNVADTDKFANYTIAAATESQTFNVNSIIAPVFTLMKNGVACDEDYILISSDKSIARTIDGALTAVAVGETDIIVRLVNYPTIEQKLHIIVNDDVVPFSGYIEGNDNIRLDRIAQYRFIGNTELTDNVVFSLDNTNYATIIDFGADYCKIQANNKNKLGQFILKAIYNNIEYEKVITVIPLW